MAEGTNEESLTKALSELSIQPSKVQLASFDREVSAQVCFPDYQSLCNAAAIIDRSQDGDKSFKRGNTKFKAQFLEASSVFVRNLPVEVTDDDLFQQFQKMGSVTNCQVLRDVNSNSKQMGLVNFISKEAAENAITKMNDKVWPGSESKQKLSVSNYRVQDRMQPGGANYKQKTNLYVSGLPNNISEAEVRQMFAEYGPIRSILLKSPTPQSQDDRTKVIAALLPIYSMAYVNFETEEAALAAFAITKKHPMSQIKVAYYDR